MEIVSSSSPLRESRGVGSHSNRTGMGIGDCPKWFLLGMDMSVCLSVRLSNLLSVSQSVCLSVCMPACRSVNLSVCLSVILYLSYIVEVTTKRQIPIFVVKIQLSEQRK
jgi:hypothetical protein